ncbi:DUF4224 domain-containing protein [Burkholderia gladioli]
MDAAELARVTGFRRRSRQVEWFRDEFGIDVVRCADGSVVMTWTQFDALLAKKSGTSTGATAPSNVELCFD